MANKPVNARRVLNVGIGVIVLMVASAVLAFRLRDCKDARCDPSVGRWLNNGPLTWKTMLVGLASGLVFGFVDNALLFAGLDVIDGLLARLPGGSDPRVLAGYGNAVSSTVSAFVSTFLGEAIASATGVRDGPLWALAVGILIGGLVGIAVPRALLGKK